MRLLQLAPMPSLALTKYPNGGAKKAKFSCFAHCISSSRRVWIFMLPDIAPFAVGDLLECRSFMEGYEGAWFRCKLTGYRMRKSFLNDDKETWCDLEYLDYVDVPQVKLYCYPSGLPKRRKALMLRPTFPLILEAGNPLVSTTMGFFAIKNRDFQVGDYVEWKYETDYWVAQVAKILNANEVQVVCPGRPWGVSGKWDVQKRLLRPALDWSPSLGWTVPHSWKRQAAVPLVSLVNPEAPTFRGIHVASPFGPDWIDDWLDSDGFELQIPTTGQEQRCLVEQNGDVLVTETPARLKSSPALIARKWKLACKIIHHAKLQLLASTASCFPQIYSKKKMKEQQQKKLEKFLRKLEDVSNRTNFCRDVLKYGVDKSMEMRKWGNWVMFKFENRLVFKQLPAAYPHFTC